MKKIAIIGATGLLGKPVTIALANAGFTITALVRNSLKVKSGYPASIEWIEGDMKKIDDIDRLLKGQDALYLSLSVLQKEKPSEWHTESDGLKLVLESAKRNNIQRIGYLSSLVMKYQGMNNFNWWVFDIKHQAVKMIHESGITYTIFYPSTFMESLTHQYKRGSMMMLAGKSEHRQHFIASEDFARQVVKSFQILTTENKDYVIQGTEGYYTEEAVALFKANYTKAKLTVSTAPIGVIKFFGLFNQTMNYGGYILESLNKYPEKFEAAETWKELGKPTISLKEFALKS